MGTLSGLLAEINVQKQLTQIILVKLDFLHYRWHDKRECLTIKIV